MAGNAIFASFGLDLSPLKRDFAQAEAIGKTGAARVQNAMKNASAAGASGASRTSAMNWRQLSEDRRRAVMATTPGRGFRTSADFLPAPAGKYPKPGEEDEEGGGGRQLFRLYRSAAITTIAGALISKFTEAAEQANIMREKVAEVTKLTGSGEFRGIGEMHDQLKASATVIDEIRKRSLERNSSLTHQVVEGAFSVVTGVTDITDWEEKQRICKAALKSINEIAIKQHDLNDAEQEQNSGSQERAAILKAEISHREKIGALASEAAAVGIDNLRAIKEENARHEIQIALIRREVAEQRALQGIESANLFRTRTGSGVTSESAKAQNIRDRLAEIAKEFPGANDTKRAKLSNERVQGQSELDAMLLTASREDPNERMARQQKAKRDAYDLAKLQRDKGLVNVHRDMSGIVISGIDPITGEKRNAGLESGGRRMDWELSKHMIAPGHMMPYGGGEDFNDFFHPNGDGTPSESSGKDNADVVGALGEVKGVLDDLLAAWT